MNLIQIKDKDDFIRYVNTDMIASIRSMNDNRWIVSLANCDDFYIDDQTLSMLIDETQTTNSETEMSDATF